jgi:hypothetical protein
MMSGDQTEPATTPAGGQKGRALINPFAKWSHDEMLEHARTFIERSGLTDYRDHLRKGASLAQSRKLFDNGKSGHGGMTLDDKEREALRKEYSDNRWDRFDQPKRLYFLVACCSLGAAVQGWYVG